jgi:hypothetical protein
VAGGTVADTVLVAPGDAGMAKKYQYWAIKAKPYLEAQFSL